MRAKKDEKIHDMAMEQKKKMEGAKKSGHFLLFSSVTICIYFVSGNTNYSSNTGGFLGIDQLTS